MILNPFFKSEEQFLSRLAGLFHIPLEGELLSNLDYIEAIERYLFQKGVEEKKTVVLLIDEAQMLPEYVLEVLRILLNYETNEFKILQLILVGQMELLPTISNMPNFWDRIALKCVINPLAKDEVADIIDFRIKQAGLPLGKNLFTNEAIALMAHHTGGYPRKLSMLCHNALEHIVMHDMDRVDADVIQELIDSELKPMTFGFNGVPDVVR
jgi:type II secretory pathway predicted ATPase ExeA